jgi:HlyD family secretion protein
VLIGSVVGAIALSAVLPYTVTVKAPATVRPSGELRLVQAEQSGTIAQIDVTANQTVEQGQVIARLDAAPLNTQQQQLQNSIRQAQIQLDQMAAQLQLIETQIEAEGRSLDRTIAIAQTELEVSQQSFQQQQATTQADLAEAEASLRFAQREMERYQQLVESGAVSPLALEERQAAVEAATAQVDRARAALNPSPGDVAIAQERITQEAARSRATLATLERERESLIQQQAALQAQLSNEQAELEQIETALNQTTIRAPHAGVLFQLNLRNPGQIVQAGETVGAIAPQAETLLVKAAVAPQDINRVRTEQSVQLRLDACPFPDYGTLPGTVTAISPDVITAQPNDGSPDSTMTPTTVLPGSGRYFEVTIEPVAQTLTRQTRRCPLQAGMTAEATILANQETFLQFILRTVRLFVR